ncbi:MAG: D-lysine 5,6-aminomutase subunit alpha [Deltaproteobacteria bacterium]|nr:D-lysine 5,6-aminomutase subunit alpha [Deltaproteobacteria bacterium]
MVSKLNLDRDKVEGCRASASKIAKNIQDFIQSHTSVSIERTVLRLFGIEEAYKDKPLVNRVIETLTPEELSLGICHWLGRALVSQRTTPISLCLRVAEGHLRLQDSPEVAPEEAKEALAPLVQSALRKIDQARQHREKRLASFPPSPRPLKYLIVATGNIYEDIDQAKAAAKGGADCIAVIRSTAQSLLDYVPGGATTEGFGGTYATQENFRLMRKAMDEVSDEVGRYIRVVNYSSGLCMAEIAAMAAVERLDYLLNDSMYGILFRDINMKRTLTDQYFSRLIIAHAGIVINTGEDNYLTTAESYRAFPQVLASQFINEQLALQAHLIPEQMGLGHAFEMDPSIPDSFLYEVAQAELVREVFPKSPIKYMPPTRHKTGDIFFGHVLDAMFNLVGVMTHQDIQLLGMATEAIHNPLLQDRFMSLKSANYIFNAARNLADEIDWSPNGKLVRRARGVLEDAQILLHKVERMGLFKAIQEGLFANMQREIDGGRGLDGMLRKGSHYWNPLQEALEEERPEETERLGGRQEGGERRGRIPGRRRGPPHRREGHHPERRRRPRGPSRRGGREPRRESHGGGGDSHGEGS